MRILITGLVLLGIAATASRQSHHADADNSEPRSKLLTVLQSLKDIEQLNYDEIVERIRQENPSNVETSMVLTVFIIDVHEWIRDITQVPGWFQWLHMEKYPELPLLEEILDRAPAYYPMRHIGALRFISAMWYALCIDVEERVCAFEASLYTHGDVQPGFRMPADLVRRVVDMMIVLEKDRLLHGDI